jgi:alanine-glyoxylate transaminase / serine-glyoxylate transaminase / serine-pyruvate transaminase
MSLLPDTERILLGPGPSLTSPRVMRAMAAPTISHLDPLMIRLLDDIRERLLRVFGAEPGSLALAVSGTGTSGMETVVANLVAPGTRALVIVSGYFGDRLAQMCERYGATVTRLEVEWGRACDPEALRNALNEARADVVAMVHAETSTGVLNPIESLAAIAREHDALTIVDAVSSLGGQPLDVGAWMIDACYSCTQKCLGGPSGLAPVVFGPRALARRVPCRSFYFDLQLLEDYWIRRKYHHTMSSTLVYALYEALAMVEEEGLESRWARHERNHRALIDGLAAQQMSVLPREGERLWTLNAIRVPDGIDEAELRTLVRDRYGVVMSGAQGPLIGKVVRIGHMGIASTSLYPVVGVTAVTQALADLGVAVDVGAAGAATLEALGERASA